MEECVMEDNIVFLECPNCGKEVEMHTYQYTHQNRKSFTCPYCRAKLKVNVLWYLPLLMMGLVVIVVGVMLFLSH
jgi:DNA-directed RNA polymerase subunit RPC12/RpoP